MAGRPTKLTPETTKKIVDAIKAGNYAKTAVALANVDESTYYKWIQRGKKATRGKYFDFCQSIKKAEEYAEAIHIQNIVEAGTKGHWQASAWWLERKKPEKWGRKEKVDMKHSGEVKKDVNVKVSVYDRIKKYESKFEEIDTPSESSSGSNDI